MTALIKRNPTIATRWSDAQLDLIKETIAKRLTSRLFDQFMESAARLRLDPLKKQITPIVFRKRELDATDPTKKVWVPYLTLITTIDGYRSIAERSGNYRPDNRTPRYAADPNLVDPLANPLGLVSAEVSVFKHAHGEWHEGPAIAFWDEYVPLKSAGDGEADYEARLDAEASGTATAAKKRIDPNTQWARRPRGQLAKCAEALALRRAFPEDFSGLYVEEELDAARIIEGEIVELTPSERAENAAVERRLEHVRAKDTILIDWMDDRPLEGVPLGKLADRCIEFAQTNATEPSRIGLFRERNRHALREFWSKAPGDANAVKKAFEDAMAVSGVAAR